MDDFRALDPFFRIIEQGLAEFVDGDHFFDLLAQDVVFDVVITVLNYPRPCCYNSQPPNSPSQRSPVTADDSKPDGQSSSTESAPCDTSGHPRRFGLAPRHKPRTSTALPQM
jgi:hypothetical protein